MTCPPLVLIGSCNSHSKFVINEEYLELIFVRETTIREDTFF
jgi:hypothetical protein